MKGMKKFLSLLLCLMMLVGMLPTAAFADETEDDALVAALAEAKAYIDGITINKTSNDPETVVKNFGTHFTWDNEKRESKKSTLFDWSYYNGVVFEGLEYVYENTKDEKYKDYVLEYMSNLVASNGTWATCSNNSSKTCSGYDGTHGGDTIKTASLLLDAYEMSGDSRYLTMAATIYNDITKAADQYTLTEAGNNLRHTWATYNGKDYELWLDGLYMVLPFRAEYAAFIVENSKGEFTSAEIEAAKTELDLIVNRMQWVSDNMYNSSKGWFYHAANSATDHSGSYWLRSMGWYAAAIADVMDSYEVGSDNFNKLQAQLIKMINGMKACQNETNGMWLNNPNIPESTKNPYETSGTALTCYAVMKAVNNGWIDASYADMALLAFKGICDEKLENNNLTDICFKGAPSSSTSANSTFYDNEGKGVGPFIMLYAEVLEYYNNYEDEIVEIIVTPPTKTTYTVGEYLDTTGIEVIGIERDDDEVDLTDEIVVEEILLDEVGEIDITVTYGKVAADFTVTVEEAPVVEDVQINISGIESTVEATVIAPSKIAEKVASVLNTEKLVAYDIAVPEFQEGMSADVTIPMPEGVDASKFMVWYVGDDGTLEPMSGHPNVDTWTYTFTTTHFSVYVGGELGATVAEGTGALTATGSYVLAENGIESGEKYLIVSGSSGDRYALYSGGYSNAQSVTITDSAISGGFSNESTAVWTITGGSNSYTVGNGSTYLRLGSSNIFGNSRNITIESQGNGAYRIYYSGRYLRYSNGFSTNNTSSNVVYLFKYVPGTGYDVTFEVSPKTATVAPGKKVELVGKVTVADGSNTEYDLSKCTITWASSNKSAATVDANGVVTGVADDTTNITATLSAVNGTALQKNIVLTIPVKVESKTVTDWDEDGFVGETVRVKVGETPVFNNAYLPVTYSDGSNGQLKIDNGLTVNLEQYDSKNPGAYVLDVFYETNKVGTVTVISTINYNDYTDATVYPEYPSDGAVRIKKAAKELQLDTTGLTEVELSVAGVSTVQDIDVVLTIDVSNSMAWSTGTNTDNFTKNKLTEVMESVVKFADIFLADNDDGTPTRNTMSIVFFAGKDTEHWGGGANEQIDSVFTACTKINDIDIIKEIAEKTKFTGRDGNEYLVQLARYDGSKVSVISGQNRGDTNYDYAFWQTEQAVDEIIRRNGTNSNRGIHVLFMTDGCATNYNGVYYNGPSAANYHKPGTSTDYDNGGEFKKLGGKAWVDWIIKSNSDNGGNIYAKSLYKKINGMYAVGFDMANGSFSGISSWDGVEKATAYNDIVSKTVSSAKGAGLIPVTPANDTQTLEKFYTSLAHELKYAGTAAQVNDTIGSNFTLQMDNITGSVTTNPDGSTSGETCDLSDTTSEEAKLTEAITPHISVKLYDLHPKGTTDANGNDLTGERIGTSSIVETVIFNADGNAAYSTAIDKDGDGLFGATETIVAGKSVYTITDADDNIMTSTGNAEDGTATGEVIINAKYFTYHKDAAGVETFNWVIGNITDKEIALSFLAYLKGSLEGYAPDGMYYTNEEATLDYIDIYNKHAQQEFPVPQVSWNGASTAYEFYYVNDKGQPINRQGQVVSFANRVVIAGPFFEELIMNEGDAFYSKDIVSTKVLPDGFVLYDEAASYVVHTSSSATAGSLTVSQPTEGKVQTTIVVDYTGKNTATTTDDTYIQSHVAFGVTSFPDTGDYELTPDKIVIDYGKKIKIDVESNNTLPTGATSELVGVTRYYENYNLKTQSATTTNVASLPRTYGTFSVENKELIYTPTSMVSAPEKIFAVLKITEPSAGTYYMANPVTVIPATSVYYETDFANVITYTGPWTEHDDTDAGATADVAPDNFQDEGPIGSNPLKTYGYDSSYENDKNLSNGESQYVLGQGLTKTYATFSFTGTGFDLISRTGATQGAIRVDVYTDADMTAANRKKSVTVLNKSESNLELYQIPVVSVNDLSVNPATYYVKVQVNAPYTNTTYPALNRGGDFYFDAIRVYSPTADAEAIAAYEIDGEANMQLTEVRAKLIADGYNADKDMQAGVTFVDNMNSPVDLKNPVNGVSGGVDVTKYTNIGPNNEVYLTKGQSIVFMISTSAAVKSVDIGAKSIKGGDVKLTAYVSANATKPSAPVLNAVPINSATAQNYNLVTEKTATDTTPLYVFVTNDGDDGVLSITDIKVGYANAAAGASAGIDLASNPDTLAFAVACMTYEPEVEAPEEPTDPEVPEETLPEEPTEPEKPTKPTKPAKPEKPAKPVKPNYDIISAEFGNDKVQLFAKATLTVTTTQDVGKLVISNQYGFETLSVTKGYIDNDDGTRTWTVSVKADMIGKLKYTITGVGTGGVTGNSKTVSVKAKLI